jgi:hypothetical protein
LRIISTQAGFYTLLLSSYDNEFKNKLKSIDTIIIDETSMVSGINVIVNGDLVQLPPVIYVSKSSV